MATYNSFKRINSEAIIDGSVTGTALGPNSIGATAFSSASVRTSDIQDSSVGTSQLASSIDLSGKTVTYRPIINTDIANAQLTGAQLATGSIATNIGYTTVNKAGDSLTGPLQLQAGSAGTPSLSNSSNNNTGIFFPAASQVGISAAGANSNLIQKSGSNVWQTQPNKPAFHSTANGGWYYGPSFGGAGGWRELTGGWTWQIGSQVGGSNLSPNGRFTAPVAGWYWFFVQDYQYNDTSNSSGYMHWVIGLNGSIATDRTTGRVPHT
jgi:hypothetical protein